MSDASPAPPVLLRMEARNLHCPACKNRMLIPFRHDFSQVDLCPSCGGFWCEPRDWRGPDLGEQPRLAGDPKGRGEGISERGPSNRACPACKQPLARLGFDGIKDFEVEQCDVCGGVWFDKREWDYLEAFRAQQEARGRIGRPTTWGQWLFNMLFRLPVEFNVLPRTFPVVTVMIILLDLLLTAMVGQTAFFEYGVVPENFQDLHGLFGRGLTQLLTHQFLHGSWVHFLGNAYLLFILGDNVEDAMGHFYFLAFYVVCGAAAGLGYALMSGASAIPLVGASGAISGVMAAYFVLYRQARLTFMVVIKQVKLPAWLWIGFWIMLQAAGYALDPESRLTRIGWLAHLGGFGAGLVWMVPTARGIVSKNALLHLIATRRI